MDEETGKLGGTLTEYISYAKDCLKNQTLEFDMQAYDDYDKMLQALQNHKIDMIFYASRNPDFAEEKGYALTNTAWTYSLWHKRYILAAYRQVFRSPRPWKIPPEHCSQILS